MFGGVVDIGDSEARSDSDMDEGERWSGIVVSRVLDRRLKTCGTSRGRNTGWFASDICTSTTYNCEGGK